MVKCSVVENLTLFTCIRMECVPPPGPSPGTSRRQCRARKGCIRPGRSVVVVMMVMVMVMMVMMIWSKSVVMMMMMKVMIMTTMVLVAVMMMLTMK